MADRGLVSVIDLFAGPGGLGEGFTALQTSDNPSCFKVRLSIEKDAHAHQTLLLRAFYRQFSPGRVPGLYYDVLRGTSDVDALFRKFPEHAERATDEAWHAELGVTEHDDVRARTGREPAHEVQVLRGIGLRQCGPGEVRGGSGAEGGRACQKLTSGGGQRLLLISSGGVVDCRPRAPLQVV